MKSLLLITAHPPQRLHHLSPPNQPLRIFHFHRITPQPRFFCIPPLSARRCGDALQPPFLVGEPLEGFVAVVCDFLLPAGCLVFPFEPGGGGFGGESVGEGGFGGGGCLLREAVAVQEGLAGRDGEEEEAHCMGGRESKRKGKRW